MSETAQMLLLWGLATVVLVVLADRGLLGGRALAKAPPRPTGLAFFDLPVALLLMAFTMTLMGPVLRWLGMPLVLPPDQLDARQIMVRSLLSQAVIQVPVVLYTLARAAMGGRGLEGLGFDLRRPGRAVGYGVVGLLVALPLVMGINAATIKLAEALGYPTPDIGHAMLPIFRNVGSPAVLAGLLFSVVIVAPVVEEILFRGLVQTSLLSAAPTMQRWRIIVPAALLFSASHIGSIPWQAMPGMVVLAIVLGWLYERTASLWPGILLHAGFNAINVAAVMLMK